MAFGSPRSFHDRFKFLIEIDGIISAGFNKMSELSVEAAKVEYYEGGALIPNKSPGRLTFSDVTLERGATFDPDLLIWMETVGDAAIVTSILPGAGAGAGLPDPFYKRTLDLVQKDRDGSTLLRWRLFNAWPQKYVAGEWDNDADEKVIEMVTLTYDSFSRITLF